MPETTTHNTNPISEGLNLFRGDRTSGLDPTHGSGLQSYWHNKNAEVEEWKDGICDLAKRVATFFLYSTKGKQFATSNRQFGWFEYFEDAPVISKRGSDVWTISSEGVLSVPLTTKLFGLVQDTIILDDSGNRENYYRVISDPVRVGDNFEIRLRKISDGTEANRYFSTKEVEVDRVLDFGADVSGSINVGVPFKLKVLYTSKSEGSKDYHPIMRLVSDTYNFVTTFERHTEISWHRASEKWRGNINLRDWQNIKMMLEFAREIERAFWVGKGYNDGMEAGSMGNLQATKGFMNFHGVQRYNTTMSSFDFVEDFIKGFCEKKVMAYNRKTELTGYVNSSMLSFISSLIFNNPTAKHYISFDSHGKQDSYGVNVKKLVTPHCDFNLVHNEFLTQHYGDDALLVCCDMDKIVTRYLSGNGHSYTPKLIKDVQNRNDKTFLDNAYAIMGLQVENANCHSVLRVNAV